MAVSTATPTTALITAFSTASRKTKDVSDRWRPEAQNAENSECREEQGGAYAWQACGSLPTISIENNSPRGLR